MSKGPVGKVCPKCGCAEYTRRKPKDFIAFADDRVCKACNTRYSPPAPVWAGMAFILSAVALPVLGFIFTALLINPFSLFGLVCEGSFCVFALAVLIGGIKVLAKSASPSK
jgi:hypothetical protein